MSEIEKYYNGEIHVDFEEIPIERKSWEELSQEIIEQHNEIVRLHSIIKEVREILKYHLANPSGTEDGWHIDIWNSENTNKLNKLLEILDKENK